MTPLLIANWKMNPQTNAGARRLFLQYSRSVKSFRNTINVVVCPPFLYLSLWRALSANTRTNLHLGAQDIFWEKEGSYTGAISPPMLLGAGVRYVLVGHSERRTHFGETDRVIAKKVKAVIEAGLSAVLCVGETKRDEGLSHFAFVKKQIELGLAGARRRFANRIIIAYEPMWAVGSHNPATPVESLEIALFIKKILHVMWRADGSAVRIIYGGSVAPENAASFLREGGMTGLLVGKESLKPSSFTKIIKALGELSYAARS